MYGKLYLKYVRYRTTVGYVYVALENMDVALSAPDFVCVGSLADGSPLAVLYSADAQLDFSVVAEAAEAAGLVGPTFTASVTLGFMEATATAMGASALAGIGISSDLLFAIRATARFSSEIDTDVGISAEPDITVEAGMSEGTPTEEDVDLSFDMDVEAEAGSGDGSGTTATQVIGVSLFNQTDADVAEGGDVEAGISLSDVVVVAHAGLARYALLSDYAGNALNEMSQKDLDSLILIRE